MRSKKPSQVQDPGLIMTISRAVQLWCSNVVRNRVYVEDAVAMASGTAPVMRLRQGKAQLSRACWRLKLLSSVDNRRDPHQIQTCIEQPCVAAG